MDATDVKNSKSRTTNYTIHEGCGGVFIFPKDTPVLDERFCQRCGRRETYESEMVIIVGKPGILEKQLLNFCKEVKVKMVGSIMRDKSRPEALAALVSLPGASSKDDPETWLKWKATLPKFYEVLAYVFRKPVAFNREGKAIPYIF